ncbi:MAG: GTPase Era [Bacillales bacterium]|nr:GTPase Era [Bacillales bacterium]
MKSGFVSIVGKTNAGKSTLINKIIKSKISIATPKPQTTRNAIQGIYNDKDSQIVFIDTPGILIPHQKLDKFMNKQAYGSLNGIDALILLIDAGNPYNEEKDGPIASSLQNVDCPLFVVFNKIDLTNHILIKHLKEKYQELFPKAKLIEISAIRDFNIDVLIREIKNVLQDGYAFYPEDMKSDHPVSFLISEIIREKVLLFLQAEVPHCVAVKIDQMSKINDTMHIDATIICEKSSQKGIIIGHQGKMLKKIGMTSRKEIEDLLRRKVNLKTFVRVEEKWRDSSNYLKEFGYTEEE